MKNLGKKVALSVLVMLCLLLSLGTNRIKLYAGEVLTRENIVEPKLNATEVSLVTDDIFNLKVYNLTENQKVHFKSDDDSIVSVSTSGAISALRVGETTITVTLKEKSVKEDKVFISFLLSLGSLTNTSISSVSVFSVAVLALSPPNI